MHLRQRIQSAIPPLVAVLILTTCGHPTSKAVTVTDVARPIPIAASGPRAIMPEPIEAATITLKFQRAANEQLWADTVLWQAAAARPAPTPPASRAAAPPLNYTPPSDLAGVKQCIKDHESGNYAESSHPGSGSGAFQYVPGTWRHWFGLWQASLPDDHPYKHVSYDLAYQAPGDVQEAVTDFTLTHGGAHNWDPSFGDDPCTVGFG